MKKLSKLLLTLALAGLMGLTMAACAPTNPGSSEETPASSSAAPSETPESETPDSETPDSEAPDSEAPDSEAPDSEEPAPGPGPVTPANTLRVEGEDASKVTVTGEPNQAGADWVETGITAASGEQSLGYLGVAGNSITLTFNSTEAGTAEIKFFMSSNNMQFAPDFSSIWVEDQTVSTTAMTVTVNGTEVAFADQTIRGAGEEMPMTWNLYFDPVTMGTQNIVAGTNTVVITFLDSTAPNFDCMDIVPVALGGTLS